MKKNVKKVRKPACLSGFVKEGQRQKYCSQQKALAGGRTGDFLWSFS